MLILTVGTNDLGNILRLQSGAAAPSTRGGEEGQEKWLDTPNHAEEGPERCHVRTLRALKLDFPISHYALMLILSVETNVGIPML